MSTLNDEDYLKRDRKAWEEDQRISIGDGLMIKPKRDFTGKGFLIDGKWVDHGWVVVEKGCNVLPGATWCRTQEEAIGIAHVYMAADRDDEKFWHLLLAFRHLGGTKSI